VNPIRAFVVGAFLAISCSLPVANATSYSTDQSDLWWNPAESGWGMQLVQRGSIIFATVFVYGQTGDPTWYVASLTPQTPEISWSGPVYASTGPWFGMTPFNPALVMQGQVGTMTWEASGLAGSLTYSVNGVTVSKSLVRQTFAGDDFSGKYGGGIHTDVVGCSDTASNGTTESIAIIQATQAGNNLSATIQAEGGATCAYAGTATQLGQMGTVQGPYTCDDGSSGSFALTELQVSPWGLIGRIQTQSTQPAGCSSTGWFGAARLTTIGTN
jgi:hypothetical protein